MFSTSESKYGRLTFKMEPLITTNANPIRQSLRRMPEFLKTKLKEIIDDLLEQNIISPSQSPWSSPVVMTKKKDETYRLCIDYVKLNKVTHKDAFPLPNIQETLDQLNGCLYFSTLDLKSGYYQIPLNDSDKEKTAFVTPFGLYEFNVLPFGLTNAPAVFQRTMQKVLNELIGIDCLVYLDDIIIFSKTKKDHINKLRRVFSRLQKFNLKLNKKNAF